MEAVSGFIKPGVNALEIDQLAQKLLLNTVLGHPSKDLRAISFPAVSTLTKVLSTGS